MLGSRIAFGEDGATSPAKITVVGVGGGGGNAVSRMIDAGLQGVKFVTVNTDVQALWSNRALHKIQIGEKLTNGLGAGANPEIGRQAAADDTEKICEALQGTDMVFITTGLGGGTGTGAAPVVASIANRLGGEKDHVLTVAVVTLPFALEGKRRMEQAREGLAELKKYADSVIAIPNDRVLSSVPRNTPVHEAFSVADEPWLRSAPYDQAAAWLRAIDGIGPWSAAFVLLRGDFQTPGDPVNRDVPAVLPQLPVDGPRNRLTLAQWLFHPDHPLTARVTVNRLWAQVFGRGIVETLGDFGRLEDLDPLGVLVPGQQGLNAEAEQFGEVGGRRIVDFAIRFNQNARPDGRPQERLGIEGLPTEARHLADNHEGDLAAGHPAQEILQAHTAIGSRRAQAEIVDNDADPRVGPTPAPGQLREILLRVGGTRILANLLLRGLPHVDDREALQMTGLDLRRSIAVGWEPRWPGEETSHPASSRVPP